MSEALIVRRGGGSAGGGLSVNAAVIHVVAPFGSTIELSKGGVAVKSLGPEKAHANADGVMADYYYPVTSANYGTWEVTASKSGETDVSETVFVSDEMQYDVVLQYIVPAEYQAVEYLQTNNGAYFDSGIALNDSRTIQVDTNIAVAVTSGSPIVFGVSGRYAASTNSQYHQWFFSYYPDSSSDRVDSAYNPVIGTKYHLIYNTIGGFVYLDGVQVAPTRPRTNPSGYGAYTVLVAADRYGGSVQYYGSWRYESFVMSDTSANTILCDLRPCYRKADNVVGFFDDVSKNFLTPLGNGTVTVGPDI